MCDPVTIGTALGAGASSAAAVGTLALGAGAMAGLQVYQGEKARKAQSRAADQARTEADQAYNRANPKQPDVAAMMASNKADAAKGNAGTMLTGTLGIDPAALPLGKSTLLGG